jgi:gliding motility-associated-like protein
VTAVPIVQFSSNVTEGCQPLDVTFLNESIAPGSVVYSWNLGDGTTSASPTILGNTYEAAQCYDVTLTVTADGLCTSTQTIADMICVHAVPQASFYYGPQQLYSDGPVADFTNTSVNHDFSSWDFGDGGTSAQEHPTHTFPPGAIGNYEVELIVSTAFGCTDTAWQVVVVKDQLLYYVPNTFTPDEDEFNPVFKPVITAGIDEHAYVLEIYDRWGELVFRTTDVDEGWDGTYQGYIHEGVYTWKLQMGMLDDDASVVDVGHVNLIR